MNYKDKNSKKFPRGTLALYAKEPVRGKVKTRMQGLLGVEGALSLHKALINYVFHNLASAQLCPIQVWVAAIDENASLNKEHDDMFLSLCNKKDIYWQSGFDLGARMAFSARQALKHSDYVVLVGADCASVDAVYLEQALQVLESGEEIVIGPAEDGGYVLLGLRSVPDCLFENVPWGEAEVLAATRRNLLEAGLRWHELAPRWDVDRPEDLVRLQSLNPPFPAFHV